MDRKGHQLPGGIGQRDSEQQNGFKSQGRLNGNGFEFHGAESLLKRTLIPFSELPLVLVFELIGSVGAPDCEIDPLEVPSDRFIHEETLGGIVHLLILKINIIFKLLLFQVIFNNPTSSLPSSPPSPSFPPLLFLLILSFINHFQMAQNQTITSHFRTKHWLFDPDDQNDEEASDQMGPWKPIYQSNHNHQPKTNTNRYYLPPPKINTPTKETDKEHILKQKFGSKSLQMGRCQIFQPNNKQPASIFYSPKKKKDPNLPAITHRQQPQQSVNWPTLQSKTIEGKKSNEIKIKKTKKLIELPPPQTHKNKLMVTIQKLIGKEGAQFMLCEKPVGPTRKLSIRERRIEREKYNFQ